MHGLHAHAESFHTLLFDQATEVALRGFGQGQHGDT
jgi:hypothetical protein